MPEDSSSGEEEEEAWIQSLECQPFLHGLRLKHSQAQRLPTRSILGFDIFIPNTKITKTVCSRCPGKMQKIPRHKDDKRTMSHQSN